MPRAKPSALATTLATTIALADQFTTSLSANASDKIAPTAPGTPSPLILLNAAAASLKSQVTKLSLLAITLPFTPSAVSACLKPVNDSVLPSLVTATLLSTPELFSGTFSSECRTLATAVLRDLQVLVRLVEQRSKSSQAKSGISDSEKKTITEATGRVWEDCDQLVKLADEGFAGFVVHKAKQWLELMKDAVKELEEWDPAEEVDDGDLFGDSLSDDGSDHDTPDEERKDALTNDDRATISAGVKDQALKVLNRIPQSIHVVVKQRLDKVGAQPLDSGQRSALDTILKRSRTISELIDESAEGMYLGDLELCLKKAGEARALTIEVVESVIMPIVPSSASDTVPETNEDKYIRRALEWIQQVDPGDQLRQPKGTEVA